MKKVLKLIRNYWLSILIASIYAGAFISYIIEPNGFNCILILLLFGFAVIAITHYLCK